MVRAEDDPTSHHQWCPVVGCTESKGPLQSVSGRIAQGWTRGQDGELKGRQGFNVLMATLGEESERSDMVG